MIARRLLIASVAAATLAGGAFAFAAGLSSTSQHLGSGTAAVTTSCSGLDSQYKIAYSSSARGFFVSEIDINQTANGVHGCTNQFFKADVDLGSSSREYKSQLSSGKAVVTPGATDLNASLVRHITAVVTNLSQS